MTTQKITSLTEAIEYFQRTMAENSERDKLAADVAALKGEHRKHAALNIGLQALSTDTDEPVFAYDPPEVNVGDDDEASLAGEIIGMLTPLKLLNPVSSNFNLGQGTGTTVPSFGIPLDPDAGHAPANTISLEEALDRDPPCPETSGLIPEMRRKIKLIREHTPPSFKIALCDLQGPYNIAHAVIGEEALTAPYTNPDSFHALMDRITTFYIDTRKNLMEWIGEDRPVPMEKNLVRICECSCNLISRDMYEQFVLPCDIRIGQAVGTLGIHTCSGPHVFHETLELLPNVIQTEAGFIAHTAAGYTPVDEALEAIDGRPIILSIGQELPQGREFETIRDDINRYAGNPYAVPSGYTGMHWCNRDIPDILDMHRRLDEYWTERVG